MNSKAILLVSVVAATLLSIMVVSITFKLAGTTDQSLAITFVAMLSSMFALDISKRLQKKFSVNSNPLSDLESQ